MKIRGKRACFSFWCVIKFACYVICIGSHTCHIKICRGTSKPIAKLFVMYVVLSKLYYVYSIVLIYQISYTLTEYFVHFNSKKKQWILSAAICVSSILYYDTLLLFVFNIPFKILHYGKSNELFFFKLYNTNHFLSVASLKYATLCNIKLICWWKSFASPFYAKKFM